MEWKFNGITIEVRCPRCGRWGRLLSRGKRNLAGFPRLMVMHNSTRNTFTESCSFGFSPNIMRNCSAFIENAESAEKHDSWKRV